MVDDVRFALQFTRRIHTGRIHIFANGPDEVILSGQVPTKQEKILAVKTAKNLSGIHQVIDRLTVESQVEGQNIELKAKIENILDQDLFISDSDTIAVSVKRGAVELGGIVSNMREHRQVIHDAFEAGATHVMSRIRVSDDLQASEKPRFYDHDPNEK
ncbi:unnamed protein product [Sphagnum tenellum]